MNIDKPPLPGAYIQQITELLGSEAPAFLDSYHQPRAQGIRLNPAKITPELREQLIQEWQLVPVSWCSEGYYYQEPVRPGKHPYHTGGLYYIQEPSAMSAVELLDPQPGETVLDMAAAPGGKTTHIAAKLGGHGLLISNEIHPARAKVLAENVERMGLANVIVTSSTPEGLSARFAGSFDRIMLDAPCSGEGMFRKDPDAVRDWNPGLVEMCASRQQDILHEVHRLLKPGGTLAYSTCTFNRTENEGMMDWLVSEYPDMELLRTERVWPHLERGEGHFVAVLHKRSDEPSQSRKDRERHIRPTKAKKHESRMGSRELEHAWRAYQDWAAEALKDFTLGPGRPLLFGEALYYLPDGAGIRLHDAEMKGLKLPRPGLHLGEAKKGRFEPAHALALALLPEQAAQHCLLSASSEQVQAYLKGETLNTDLPLQGWVLVSADGIPLGWAKASGGQLKNRLPKGLRHMTGL